MTTCLLPPLPPWYAVPVLSQPAAIRRAVIQVLRSDLDGQVSSAGGMRGLGRRALRSPCYVSPAAFDGTEVFVPPKDPARVIAIAKDISYEGLGFLHDVQLEAQHIIASFGLMLPRLVSLLVEVRWSQAIAEHRHVSGGRFVGVVDLPVEA